MAHIEHLSTELKGGSNTRKAAEEKLQRMGSYVSIIGSRRVENEEGGGRSYVEVLTHGRKNGNEKVKEKKGLLGGREKGD